MAATHIDGMPVADASSSRLAEILRYGNWSKQIRAAAQHELWRREQGREGMRAADSADEVNRLLVEGRRR